MTRLIKGFGKHKRQITVINHNGYACLRVALGRQKTAIIDVADYDILHDHSFHAHKRKDGNWVARSSQTGELLHRLVMCPYRTRWGCDDDQETARSWYSLEVDHINHQTLDNRRINLRACTPEQNKLARLKTTIDGFYGIKRLPSGIYKAYDPDQKKYLGRYETPDEAGEVYDENMITKYEHMSGREVHHTYAFITINQDLGYTDGMKEWYDYQFERDHLIREESKRVMELYQWRIKA